MPKQSTKTSTLLYGDAQPPFLAPYACFSHHSRGRLHKEPESTSRSVFQRDRDRIIHCAAFRRLEYKTQVFVNHEGDHYRTRLTHSLEVAQLARSVARELALDEDLAEALALAHDLGHPPFGHAGEDVLSECMADFGGFDHNGQSLRVVTHLERIYAEFDGLNLTWETLEGIAKHNGPLVSTKGEEPEYRVWKEYNTKHDLQLHSYPSLEAQLAAVCDDIAYNNHDIEDGLRAGLISIDDLRELPLVGEVLAEVLAKYPDLEQGRLTHELRRRVINRMCNNLVHQTSANIAEYNVQSVDDVRAASQALAQFSPDMEDNNQQIKTFLREHMYNHYKVNRMVSKARRIVGDLFAFFLAEPECLPTDWSKQAGNHSSQQTAELVADYIAGMTDRYAFEEHKRIFDLSRKLMGG